eukprot:446363_1
MSRLVPDQHHANSKMVKKVLTIFENILTYPANSKYQNLNLSRISKLFKNWPKGLEMLYSAGFYRSDNGKRLLFDIKKLDQLKLLYDVLSHEPIKQKTLSKNKSRASAYLLYPNYIHRSTFGTYRCGLLQCPCFNVIAQILKIYNDHIQSKTKESIYSTIYNKIGHNYSNIDLLNDFNHLLLEHIDEFENIYNKLSETIYNNKGCNLKTCLLMKRNQRNRFDITKNAQILNRLYYYKDDIVEQQLLDRIHSYFFIETVSSNVKIWLIFENCNSLKNYLPTQCFRFFECQLKQRPNLSHLDGRTSTTANL